MTDHEEVQRWSNQLRLWVTAQGRSQRSVERELGWGSGYLSQLFRPTPPDLKIKHVLGILRAIKVPPKLFFSGLYGRDSNPDDLRNMTRDEVLDFIALSLRQELVKLGQSARPKRGKKRGRPKPRKKAKPAKAANGPNGASSGEPPDDAPQP